MKNRYIIYGLVFSLTCSFAHAQQVTVKEKKMGDNGIPTFLFFDTDSTQYKKGEEETIWKEYLDITSSDQLEKVKRQTDKQGMEHIVFQQYYKGIKVENATYRVHLENGKIRMANGRFIKINDLEVMPKLQDKAAVQIALDKTGASKYAWESEGMEKMLKEETGNETATYYPEAELVIWHPYRDNTTFLAYKIKVYSLEPYNHEYFYIDASNGSVLDRDPIAIPASVTGSADTRYSGTQSLKTESFTSGYRLRDPSRGNGIETYDMNQGTDFSNAVDFVDGNNNWISAEWHNAQMDDAALDAHWALQNVYDYFLNEHGRESYNDANAKIKCYMHFDYNWENAAWSSDRILLGDGNGVTNGPRTAIDVMGHEFGHGVCQETCDLEYESESGAMNEGFSDIWGACVENYCVEQYDLLNKEIWIHGQDYNWTTGGTRSLIDPNDFGQPDTYGGTFWYNTTSCTPVSGNDYCGVHTNSGVMNHWFYLLSAGDGNAHTNDNGDCYFVEGIGMEDAAEIVYSLEADYLDSESDFDDARTYSIQAARNLNEEIQITNAWYAVGVGDQFTDYPISGPTLVCSSGATFTLDYPPAVDSIVWTTGSYLAVTGGQGTSSCTISATGNGSSWIQAELITASDTITVPQQEIWVGDPEVDSPNLTFSSNYGNEASYLCTGVASGNQFILPAPDYSFDYYEYKLTNLDNTNTIIHSYSYTGTGDLCSGNIYAGYYLFWVRNVNDCGISNWFETEIEYVDCVDEGEGLELLISPNPTASETTLSIKSTSEEITVDEDEEWTVEVYTNTLLLKTKKTKIKGIEYKIMTSNWKEGIYMIRVMYKDEVLTGKLIVTR
ncbi:MAG: M4 family metallopeptidase [Bacteroidales bacterium]|nr:M4 family metallopeptidase [Bacteroidales bacterium]